MNEREARLQARFKLIEQALAEKFGPRLAYAAGAAAHLQTIHSIYLSVLANMAGPERTDSVILVDTEITELLQSFHAELCTFLHVEPEHAVKLSAHFRQLMIDLLNEKG